MSTDAEGKGRARAAGLRRKTILPGQHRKAALTKAQEAERKARLAFRDTEAKLDRIRGVEVDAHKKRKAMAWDLSEEEEKALEPELRGVAGEDRAGDRRALVRWIALGALLVFVLSTGLLVWSGIGGRGPMNRLLGPGPAPARTLFMEVNQDLILRFLDSYYGVDSWEERVPLVRYPERTRPLMAAYYAEHPLEERPKAVGMRVGTLWNENREYALALIPETITGQHWHYAFEPTAEGLLLDWESTVGYSEIRLDDLLEERPEGEKLVRVRLDVYHYYNYLYGNPDEWACFRAEQRGVERWFYGYIRRDSPGYALLEQAMKISDVQVIYPTLKVRVNPESTSDDQFEIVEVVNRYWLIP
ncbi:MAG TPA: hypothetical protein VMN36_09815 [Verrucomicrobiales bacterium]|nr:hypothetical protein [Verrucomicrobiales bacterium]